MASHNLISGLDIGTTKIAVIIGEVDERNSLNIIGVGIHPSDGLRRGVVINLDKTVRSIEKAVEAAELMAGVNIDAVYTGIAGDHIRSLNSRGIVAVGRSDNEITPEDMRRSIDAAKAIALPMDREIIHIIPQEYIVDDQNGIKEPLGMSGVRLEVDAHIVTGAITSAQNIYKAVQRTGLKVKDLVLEPLASSYAALNDDERELGVALLDMGGGTSDMALFYEGTIRHTGVIGLGGKSITNDIALGLRTPLEQAENIKLAYGSAFQSAIDEDEIIEVPGVGGRESRQVSRSVLASIIQPRVEEIFYLALREMKRSDYIDLMTCGLVLTGGTAMLDGIVDLAEQIFDMPVKVGYPMGFGGLVDAARSPAFATGVGLIQYGLKHGQNNGNVLFNGDDSQLFYSIIERMKHWIREFF